MFTTCKKPDETLKPSTKSIVSARHGSDELVSDDPAIFKEFTDKKPNAKAPDNERPSPVLRLTIPNSTNAIPIKINYFKPFDLSVKNTYFFDPAYYFKSNSSNITNGDDIYYASQYYYSNIDLRDVPPETGKNFLATFSIDAPPQFNINLYARIFYQAEYGFGGIYEEWIIPGPLNQNNSKSFSLIGYKPHLLDTMNFYGASKIVTLTPPYSNQTTTTPFQPSSILYKIEHDPQDKWPLLLGGEQWPESGFNLPRAGYYDIMLVVSTDSNNLKIDLKKNNPFPYFGNLSRIQFTNSIYKVIRRAMHFTCFNEDFSSEKAYKGVPEPPENVFSYAWYPGEEDIVRDQNYDSLPGILRVSDDYTMDEYKNELSLLLSIDFPYIMEYNNSQSGSTDPIYHNTGLRMTYKGQNPLFRVTPDDATGGLKRSGAQVFQRIPFVYGRTTARMRFAQVLNPSGLPTGRFPAFWLYEFPESPLNANLYTQHCNETGSLYRGMVGNQPQEIDIEIYPNGKGLGNVLFGFSIHDYGCEHDKTQRFYINSKGFHVFRGTSDDASWVTIFLEKDKNFIEQYHEYEIDWLPGDVIFKIDNNIVAHFTSEDARIPDREMRIWFSHGFSKSAFSGHPNCDGLSVEDCTFKINYIPFQQSDEHTFVDWVKVEGPKF